MAAIEEIPTVCLPLQLLNKHLLLRWRCLLFQSLTRALDGTASADLDDKVDAIDSEIAETEQQIAEETNNFDEYETYLQDARREEQKCRTEQSELEEQRETMMFQQQIHLKVESLREGIQVTHKALRLPCVSTAFLSKTVHFLAVRPARPG
eukprot:SAG22_NODE_1060_length_5764_cov_2.176876_4_plen_151_part_00